MPPTSFEIGSSCSPTFYMSLFHVQVPNFTINHFITVTSVQNFKGITYIGNFKYSPRVEFLLSNWLTQYNNMNKKDH